ncbi:MAG: hypothetical protein IJU79_03950 [Desulfovibrionaceae bacterium]|nr:hypothetical protein [Desulfovibrionaceae bacterium]
MAQPFYLEVAALSQCTATTWPKEFQTKSHLIYSSPATLSFNSPGAEGFGVKRAALTMPESIMLLFSPGCCGRNTSAIGGPDSDYGRRTYYLLLDDTDIVTGRYLQRIVEACEEIVTIATPKPQVIMLCSTCVDALLGTDMQRLCRDAQAATGCHVLAATMYALTREGHLPPMVGVRQTLYSLLEPKPKHADTANILGFFTHLDDTCELYTLLHNSGIKHIYELGRMHSQKAYQAMAQANFNLVLHPEARHAANYLYDTLKIPAIELTRTYQLTKISQQYKLLGQILQVDFNLTPYAHAAQELAEQFSQDFRGASFAVGEGCNAKPFDLALALLRLGCKVPEIFAIPQSQDLAQLKALSQLSPTTRIYSNQHPSMFFYQENQDTPPIDFCIGKAARYYHPNSPGIDFSSEIQPFGFMGLMDLIKQLQTLNTK